MTLHTLQQPLLTVPQVKAGTEVVKLREALNNIDALDPEEGVQACSISALAGMVNRMGAIARAALSETEGKYR